MENSNESQDQMSTSPTSTGSAGRPVPVENIHVEFTELPNAAGADQASNDLGDGVAPCTFSVIGDINCEVDTEIRHQGSQVNGNQPPVCSERQPSTNEDFSLKQAQDIEKNSHYYCGVCLENVQVNGSCQRVAHEECLHASGLSLTNCNCFHRKRTVNGIDYPAALTSPSKQPTTNDDVSDTWENHPLQTFPQHSKVLSLCCEICGKEEVFMKSLCCNSEYHQDCFNQCREEGHTNCLYCRCPMQEGGRRNGGGEDDSGSNGGGRGRGGGLDGGRVDDDVVGENNSGGGDGREGHDRGDDEGDPGGGGDDDGGCGGSGFGGGSPLPSQPLPPSSFLQLLLPPLNPLFFLPNHHQLMTEMKRKILKEELMIKVEMRIQIIMKERNTNREPGADVLSHQALNIVKFNVHTVYAYYSTLFEFIFCNNYYNVCYIKRLI